MVEQAALSCDPLGSCRVVGVDGSEAMNALPRVSVNVLSDDGELDLVSLMRAPATLAFAGSAGALRETRLLVVEAAHVGATRDGHLYSLVLSSPLAILDLRSGYRIFQDLTSQEITAKILADAGIDAAELRLQGRYSKRLYTVQYGESELSFLQRLLADDGINYWFQDEPDRTVLVLGDGDASHSSVPDLPAVRFDDASGLVAAEGALVAFERTARLCHGRVLLSDFDVRAPDVLIRGEAGNGGLAYYEHPACVPHSEAATARAKVRHEQLQRHAVTLAAKTTSALLSPGRIVRIDGAADEWFDGKFLVVEARHSLQQASPNDATDKTAYACGITLVPFGNGRPFRPALPERVPRTAIVESAEVTGPAGEEIHTDDLGRIKARFRWDRSGIGDDRSSLWIRHLQMHMEGSMLLPRVGWEVPVLYEEGNPDRPVALGRLYNGGAQTPYPMPAKKATSTLQTATSPRDGTTQELRFGDDAGSQEAFIHATKDQTVYVGGSHTVSVASNRTDDVKKSAELGVKGNQTRTVSGNQSVTVGADAAIGVEGSRTESIGGTESVGVTGSYATAVKGAYAETVGGLYALQCNQSNTTVQGTFTQLVGAAMVTTAGLGVHQSVAAVRMEELGGMRAVNAASAFADEVRGSKTITAGAASDTAGGFIATNAAAISVDAGSASLSAGGELFIKGATISIKAGTLTAKGGSTFTLSGGASASSSVKLDAGTVEKPQTSKTG
ncbi:MAG: type VI secretion system tip protein TssI/VgrG [Polyangiaceae bacterium]